LLGFGHDNGSVYSRKTDEVGVDDLPGEVARVTLAIARTVWHETDGVPVIL
jgi:hypothetical protein